MCPLLCASDQKNPHICHTLGSCDSFAPDVRIILLPCLPPIAACVSRQRSASAAATREGPVSFWPASNAAHFAFLLPSTLLSHSRVSRLRKELRERITPVRSQSKDFYALANTSSSLFVSHATKRACDTQVLSSTQDSSWLFWFLISRELRSRKRESCRGVHLRG